jgi:hypothetical protein
MDLLLAIQSYTGANSIVARHWPYYLNSGAKEIHGIGTTDGGCVWPSNVPSVLIGENRYMDGKHLPIRLLDTIEYCLSTDSSHFCIVEYDTLFLRSIPEWVGIAAHLAGGQTFNSKASTFIHNPWFLDRPTALAVLNVGRELVSQDWPITHTWHIRNSEGWGYGCAESSPDVFLAWVCEEAKIPVRYDLMREFSRNSLDRPGALEEARAARLDGVDIIHGVKLQSELDYIMSAP